MCSAQSTPTRERVDQADYVHVICTVHGSHAALPLRLHTLLPHLESIQARRTRFLRPRCRVFTQCTGFTLTQQRLVRDLRPSLSVPCSLSTSLLLQVFGTKLMAVYARRSLCPLGPHTQRRRFRRTCAKCSTSSASGTPRSAISSRQEPNSGRCIAASGGGVLVLCGKRRLVREQDCTSSAKLTLPPKS